MEVQASEAFSQSERHEHKIVSIRQSVNSKIKLIQKAVWTNS